MMEDKNYYEYILNIIRSINNKKTLKMVQPILEYNNQKGQLKKEYYIIRALLDNVQWENYFKNSGLKDTKDMVKINYLSKYIKEMSLEDSFVDNFPITFSMSQARDVILKYPKDFLQILKLSQQSEIILSFGFSNYNLDEGIKKMGQELLKQLLKDFFEIGKPLEFPQNFVLFAIQYLKLNFRNFKDVQQEIFFFYETTIMEIKDQKLKSILSIGEMKFPIGEQQKDPFCQEYLNYLENSNSLEETMESLGPSILVQKEKLSKVFLTFKKLREKDVLKTILMMMRQNYDFQLKNEVKDKEKFELAQITFAFLNFDSFDYQKEKNNNIKEINIWDIESFIKSLKNHFNKRINWREVLNSFVSIKESLFENYDNKQFFKTLFVFLVFLQDESSCNLPLDVLYVRWNNKKNQFLFLSHLIEGENASMLGIEEIIDKRRNLNIQDLPQNLQKKVQELPPLFLNKDLLEILIELAPYCNREESIQSLIQSTIGNNFEGMFLLLISLKITTQLNGLRTKLLNSMLLSILNSSAYTDLIRVFFQIDQNYMIKLLVKVCERENNFIYLSKILDFSQSIKDFFLPLTQLEYHYFSISLSLLAIKREFLRLENWIEGRLQTGSLVWVEEFLKYVYKMILQPLNNYTNLKKKQVEEVLEKSQITMNGLAIIFENFLLNERYTKHIPEMMKEKIMTLYKKIQVHIPELSQVCTNETEKIANSILEELYFGYTTIESFVEKVKKLKQSKSNRDQEILSCIIINIIDEFRFYQNFPEKELFITSDIFGNFIGHQIIDGKVLMVFLKALSDSLESEGKMFLFGCKAVELFILKDGLNISTEFYKLLYQNIKLREKNFKMLFDLQKKLKKEKKLNQIPQEYLEDVNNKMKAYLNALEPKERIQQKVQKNVLKKLSGKSSKYQEKTLMDFLKTKFKSLEKNIEMPKLHKEKIIFWMNSIDDKKLDIKIVDFSKILENINVIKWFSIYFVYKRIPYEPSMQNTYRKLIFRSNIKVLYYEVYSKTMKMINELLDYIMSKDKILPEEQNISRHCGKWVGFITLVCNRPILLKDFDMKRKILQAVEQQKLANIIPVICTILVMTDKSTFFNAKVPFINSMFDILREIITIPWIPSSTKVYIEVLFNQLEIKIKDLYHFNYIYKKKDFEKNIEKNIFLIRSLPDYVKIDSNIVSENDFKNKYKVDLKQIVAMAVDQSIKDIIQPVLDRSVSNTLETTRELALKDFMGEGNFEKVMAGVEAMITNLTWNLALVTCREPLRAQITQHLSNFLKQQTEFSDLDRKNLTESLSHSNLNLACNIVKNIVINNALEMIKKDQAIINQLELRRQTGQEQWTCDTFQWLQKELPSELNPSDGNSCLGNIEIYTKVFPLTKNILLPPKDTNYTMWQVPLSSGNKQNLEEQKILELFQKLEKEIKNPNNVEKMKTIHQIYSQLSKILKNTKNIENQIFGLAEIVLKKLFKTPFTVISIEMLKYYSDVLIIYSNINPKLPKMITQWIFQLKEQAFKHHLIAIFLRRNLLHLQNFDELYAKELKKGSTEALNCVVQVLKNLVIEEKIFSIHSFPKILHQLTEIGRQNLLENQSLEVSIFMKNLLEYIENKNKINSLMFRLTNLEPEYKKLFQDVKEYFKELNTEIYQQVVTCLKQWMSVKKESEMSMLIKDFDEKIIRKNEKTLIIFFCYLFEISVNKALMFSQNKETQDIQNLDYSYINAITTFITILLKSSADSTYFFEKILTSLIIVLTKKHYSDVGLKFNQKPFFKILFNIIYDLNRSEYDFKDQLDKFSVVLVQTLHILQPIKYPGFAFAWLQLVSSKFLIKTILRKNNHEIWNHYTILLIDLMIFYKDVFSVDFLIKEEMKMFYKGTLRILLVLIHDFPGFLSEQSFVILEEIPSYFKQFRNIILCAYPKNLKIPNPFNKQNDNQKNSPEYNIIPPLSQKIEDRINSHNLHSVLINFIKKKEENKNNEHLKYILSSFYITGYNNDIQINVPLLESFVVYVPYFLYSNIYNNQPSENFNEYLEQSYSLFIKILQIQDYELNDKIINAILNNLRYANHITFYFIDLILLIFQNTNEHKIFEQIIKNLLDRLIIEKPHPFGILSLLFKIITQSKFYQNQFYLNNKDFVDKIVDIAFKYARIKKDN